TIFGFDDVCDVLTTVVLEDGKDVIHIGDGHLCWDVAIVSTDAVDDRCRRLQVISLEGVLRLSERMSKASRCAVKHWIFVSYSDLASQNDVGRVDSYTAVHINAVKLLRWWVVLAIVERHFKQIEPVISALSVDETLIV